jgi:hypothetical protein
LHLQPQQQLMSSQCATANAAAVSAAVDVAEAQAAGFRRQTMLCLRLQSSFTFSDGGTLLNQNDKDATVLQCLKALCTCTSVSVLPVTLKPPAAQHHHPQ